MNQIHLVPLLRVVLAGVLLSAAGEVAALAGQNPVLLREFVYESAPFPSVHASTIEETLDGTLVTAFFGGSKEGNKDVAIWVSRKASRPESWTPPIEVANGVQPDGSRHPCWNPVLFQPRKGPLMLFYKVGPSPSTWWGMLLTSADNGRSWGTPRRLPEGILGPIKNKPIQLPDGDILSPSSTEHDGWRVHFERSSDLGKTWTRTPPVNDGREFAAIQPTLLQLNGGHLLALGRTRQGKIFQISSSDSGITWSPMTATSLPNPNSGIDAVTLKDGRHLLIYNHTDKGRSPLNLAVSPDGQHWHEALVLENQPGEYSYPAIIQTRDGRVHAVYTWKRQKVQHVVLDPALLD
jgi:predicted neuraminidase